VTWAEKRRAAVSGGEIAFVEAGDPAAPPVVLIAGALTSSYLWRRLIPLLSPWMRVIAPDLLSSGDSAPAPDADLTLRGHADSVRELLRGLGVERFAVAGHGHGGGVAQLLALGDDVETLVLVDSIAFDARPRVDVEDRLELEGWTARVPLSDDDLEEYLRPFRGEEGLARLRRVASSLGGEELAGLEPRLAALEVPALVLWGEEDALIDVSLAERLGEALPWATVALLPGCGHLLLEDAPETAAPLIFQWLRARYLKIEHRHEEGPVTVYLGRRPPGEGG
jgi:pimeloyl-ACP methyl ester carboxylesterase